MTPSSFLQSSWAWVPEIALDPGEQSGFDRLWRGLMVARIGVALVLLVLLSLQTALGMTTAASPWLIGLCATYAAAAVAVRMFTRPRAADSTSDPQWALTIGVDIVALSTLHYLQAGGINYSPLFALPVLTAAVLGSGLLAFGTAAAVTLVLLADAAFWIMHNPAESAARFVQAGLTGGGHFLLALMANQLAVRLAREELTARRSQVAARTQAQVNELVIETLTDGVLVVGPDCRVHTVNPAARELLGWRAREMPASLALGSRPGWQPLVELAQLTFMESAPKAADIMLSHGQGERIHLLVRTRLTPRQQRRSGSLCVMFLEDLRETEARLRTEKLAAMGRMSAAVAHEIRNPLAAIAQANALLQEELVLPTQRQLSDMVRQNSQRLSNIVDEILDIARVQQQDRSATWLPLDDSVRTFCEEWIRHTKGNERVHLRLDSKGVRVLFESEHLRRVLVNLLDNALRYASGKPGCIRVLTQAAPDQAWLRVWSDGAPLDQGVQRHLFEPFFSSESRSTGLGLYICRELCERHGGSIGYRRTHEGVEGTKGGNEFFISLRMQTPVTNSASFDTIGA